MNALTQSRRITICIFLVAAFVAAFALIAAQPSDVVANAESMSVTNSRGALHVNIPYHADHDGAGQLTLEVLDPEDQVLVRTQRHVEASAGHGHWQEDLKLEKPVPIESLVWHRLRYRFIYSDGKNDALEATESISEILRMPVVHILGQQSYLSGGPAAVRIIVEDSKGELIPGGGSARLELLEENQKPRTLFAGKLNRRGTTEAQFRFPAGLAGNYQLRYQVETPIGTTEYTQDVRLEDKVSILLTTEKPIYQPGQTIHVRSLSLDRSNHEAAANKKMTFEIEDSRGNKVFKKIAQTDKFGVASMEFVLADEVNLGTYHLRALMGETEGAPTNTAEIALNVERYVLPKFKVAIDFASPDKKGKRGYRPGEHVTGTVHANYFFGKPVDGSEVTVKASGMDVALFEAASAQGKTDRDGSYHFDLHLPEYFAGHALTQGAARVLVEATVKDSASHSETRGEPITVSESPLLVTAVPEGGTLAPNLPNEVFILTSYPDGTPASTDLKVRTTGNREQRVSTDRGGVAVVQFSAAAGNQTLHVEAADKEGNHVSRTLQLQSRGGEEQILLRAERAVYRTGDRIQLKVFSTKQRGTAYVDIVKEGQTILTRDLDIIDGQAQLSLSATPEMAGTVDFSAYLFGRDAQPIGDHRLIFVQPADELKIETSTDSSSYKPGDEARVRFRVTNSRGEGVSAALGLQVVDEAVFALAEKQPGFAKVFFYLEQEVLKPRYEIHSIGLPMVAEPVEDQQVAQRDRAARALFSATEMVSNNNFRTEFGRSVPQIKYAEYAQRYRAQFLLQVHRVAASLSRGYSTDSAPRDLQPAIEKLLRDDAPELRDSWGTKLRFDPWWDGQKTHFLVRSAGPDKQFNTNDDVLTYLEIRRRKIVGHPSAGPNGFDVNIEHERGSFTTRAEITGTVADQRGGAIEGAGVVVTEAANGRARFTQVGADGRFRVSGLAAGDFHVQISTGSDTLSRKLHLEPRDRAVISAFFRQQSDDTMVTVNDGLETVIGVAGGIGVGFGAGRGAGVARDAGDMVDRKEVRDLPMEGRNVVNMMQLVPGASPMVMPRAATQSVEVSAASPLLDTNSLTLASTGASAAAPTHVRSYFPEALYINPEIITDQDGRASITIPLADSITTWRMAMLASTAHGALGSSTASIKVFQDFFVDLDLPVTLTQGDRVSIPVALYNYSSARGDVNLQLKSEEWFSLVDDNAEKSVSVDSGRVGGSQYTVEAKRIGKFKLTLSAQMVGAANREDIVVREIEVIPNGREDNVVFNGRLESQVQHQINFPAESIPDAETIFVRLYPGPLSQVIEGMDSILRMPGGCFEQTSSSTYPNVLALDYMKRTKKLTPEVHAKAEGYIANGYQRLLTFEVPGGGFSWFGNAPANKILTSYGLMEFSDMSHVYDIDPKLIQRTQQWLASQQQADGSWKPDDSFINEGATNRFNSNVLRITAYIAWSLQNTGYQGPAVQNAKHFIESHMSEKADSYTLAVLANFAVDYAQDRDFTRQAMQLLLDAHQEKDEQAWWSANETGVYATGESASVETTGLAVQALLKWGQASATARKAMTYIAAKKDSSGTWGTTQATIMALRALLLASERGAADVRGTLEVLLNGKSAEKLTFTPENNDLLHQFVFKAIDPKEANSVEIRFDGKSGLAYQVVGRYFVPWDKKPLNEALSIDVAYDRTSLAQDDLAKATATIKNNLPQSANMVMVDLGIPPGFDLLAEDLQSYVEKSASQKSGRLEKFSLTATQAILYFDSLAAGDTVAIHFHLRAKYPIRARTFKSRVYEYYDPAVSAVAKPVLLEVRKR
jgi:uncharacterized protein YfaS (alpha-2-macroglobulin family)